MWEMQALSSSQNQNLDPNNLSSSSTSENGLLCEMDSSIECLNGSLSNNNGRCESDTNLNADSIVNSDVTSNSMQIDSAQNNILGSSNNLIPTTGVAATVAGLTPCNTVVTLPNDPDRETVFVETSGGVLHPALRGIKAVNIGN